MVDAVGPLVFDLLGKELSGEEKEILTHPAVGGLIFFARNYESPQQITQLCSAVRAARKTPILICVDQEGGRVQRFREGFTRIPSMGELGKLYDLAPEKAFALATTCGWVMAAELLNVGVDLSFAPVLDVDLKINPAIGNRAFHQQHAVIVNLAKALTAGMRATGMAAVGKHFPGHGSVMIDSHLDLPIDTRPYEEIAEADMPPFVDMIRHGIEGLMAAHILFSEVDATAVGFSSKWLKDILRKQLKFSGIVFSDDLSMEGGKIAGDHPQRVEAALKAGCDMALLCNNRAAFIKTLDTINTEKYKLDASKVAPLRGHFSLIPPALMNSKSWREKSNLINEFVGELQARSTS
jgi:beta-N-acetylhexosaminidase